MKILVRSIAIAAITLLALNQAGAQTASYTTNGGMTIGFGLGTSYQGSDIANSIGSGYDFRLGHQLYRKDNAFIGVDWRFRFLAGGNKAFDHRINIDDTYSNIRYSFFTYDLELAFTLNRLRERTRIIITGFAGAGITHGRTFTDLYDSNNNLYDFTGIDPSKPASEVKADLMALSDKDFETRLTNRGAVLPTAGIYIGYQFTHSFSIGIEHKTNFSLNENNSGFGIDIDNKIATGSAIDMNHYTSLGFRWSLGGGRSRSTSRPTGNYQNAEISPVTHKDVIPTIPVTERPGLIVNLDSLRQQVGAITSTLNTISSAVNTITSTVNTTNTVTTTNPVTTTSTTTRPGGTTTNPVTSTRPVTTRPVQGAAPELRFINPPSPVTVEDNLFSFRVQTTNIAAWQDVEVVVNGVSNSNFSFSREGLVILNIGLKEGQNSVEVSGKNESGRQSGSTTITYKRAAPVAPVTNPVTTSATNPVTTTVTNPVTTTVTNPVTTTVTNPVTTTVTNPVTTSATNPVTTTVTNPVTTTVTNPVTTTVSNPVANTVTNTVTTPAADKPCGVRINPGNSSWQFCLITSGGTFNRESLANKEFTYSGPAGSLYFMPIAGGGDVIVKGKPFKVKPGQYYLFTGNLTVTVGTKNPGSMGQWSVCINTDKEPLSGNGNNRPPSPCEKNDKR